MNETSTPTRSVFITYVSPILFMLALAGGIYGLNVWASGVQEAREKQKYTITYYGVGNVPIKVYTGASKFWSQKNGVEFEHEGKTVILRGNVEVVKE